MTTISQNKTTVPPPLRLLLVEDDEATRESVTLKLQREDFDVVAKDNGHTALEYLRTDASFDIILLDIHMPKKDGFEFLEEKNNDAILKDIPVIIFSNFNQPEHVERALALGVKGYLVKAHHSINQIASEVRRCVEGGVCIVDK